MKILNTDEKLSDYIHDESRKTGYADAVLLPESEAELVSILTRDPVARVTVQGARTGLTAGCVPFGGIGICMERMNKVISIDPDQLTARVQPGIALQTLRSILHGQGLTFMPDPTETSASIGGMINCNSSGARTYKYGPTRAHIRGLRLVLRNGDALVLERGSNYARGLDFSMACQSGRVISGRLPDIRIPDIKKHNAGYYVKPDMDMIDLFIGSEGSLGIVTEATLDLRPLPAELWGCIVFFDGENQALDFVDEIRSAEGSGLLPKAEAIEYFGPDTLALMRAAQENGHDLQDISPISEMYGCGIYIEHSAGSADTLKEVYRNLHDLIKSCGGDPDKTWLAINDRSLKQLKDFRHGAPASVNRRIAQIKLKYPEITKLGTDMALPEPAFRRMFRQYRRDLASGGFDAAVFGHIGDCHLHVNIMPRDMKEYERGKELYKSWARLAVSLGGTVSAEHGIGKLKTWLLRELYTDDQLGQLLGLKLLLDPRLSLGPGNIFPEAIYPDRA